MMSADPSGIDRWRRLVQDANWRQARAGGFALVLLAVAAVVDWVAVELSGSVSVDASLWHVVVDVGPTLLVLVTAFFRSRRLHRFTESVIGFFIVAAAVLVVSRSIASIGSPVHHPWVVVVAGLLGVGLNVLRARVMAQAETRIADAGGVDARMDIAASLLVVASGGLAMLGLTVFDPWLGAAVGGLMVIAGIELVRGRELSVGPAATGLVRRLSKIRRPVGWWIAVSVLAPAATLCVVFPAMTPALLVVLPAWAAAVLSDVAAGFRGSAENVRSYNHMALCVVLVNGCVTSITLFVAAFRNDLEMADAWLNGIVIIGAIGAVIALRASRSP